LINSGSSVTQTDEAGCTPLHWAAAKGHLAAVKLLLDHAPEAVNIKAKSGNTPVVLAKQNNSKEVYHFLTNSRTSQSILSLLSSCATNLYARLFLWPAVYIPILVFILSRFSWYISLACALLILFLSTRLVSKSGKQARNSIMMGTFLWSHCYSIAIYKARILPFTYAELWWFHIPFYILNLGFYECYRRLVFEDPGYLEFSPSDSSIMIQDLKSGANFNRYCATCLTYRPYRSKHCPECGKCVLKMDHHCPFTGNCVGAGNLGLFYLNLSLYMISDLSFFWLCTSFSVIRGYTTGGIPLLDYFWILSEKEPILWGMLCWHILHFTWLTGLWIQQTYQIVTNLTSNETYNYKRYDYLKDPATGSYYNPYNKSIVENIHEAFFESPKEILAKTREFPVKPENFYVDRYSYLPTNADKKSYSMKEL